MATLVIKQTKSAIGRTKRQKRTLESLGLKKVNHTKEHQDTETIKGMIAKVIHLIEVQEK